MRDPFECDDPLAERRYSYAKSAAEEGDWATAAEVYEQSLELAPHWAPAWFGLGEAREKLGDIAGAAAAFRAVVAADEADAHGAGARLALLGHVATTALPPAYIARLFDDYAPRFAAHLTNDLSYRGPQLIVQALDRLDSARRFPSMLDLGCGTGLAAAALRARVDNLVGVDLSPRMVEKSLRTGLYDLAEVGEALAFLERRDMSSADLIVAADVLVYFGDLQPLFAAAARVLNPQGWFAFSIEAFEGEGFRLDTTMRFAHSASHVQGAAESAGLRALTLSPAPFRREAGRDVEGRIGVYGKALG
jgi:predicted TPR repeat methyltransferase